MTAPSADTQDVAARTLSHDTFEIDRRFDAPVGRVFGAFADPVAKARWFGADVLDKLEHELDFRVGGREIDRAKVRPDGPTFGYEARYEDIVPDVRIVQTYTMTMDGRRISASLQTVEFLADGPGTRLILTEQLAIFDGLDTIEARRHGTGEILDALAAYLAAG